MLKALRELCQTDNCAWQEQEFERAATCDTDTALALALASGCDVSVAAQVAGLCDDDDVTRARELALSDAVQAATVAADAALALRLSFEMLDAESTDEVRPPVVGVTFASL